MEKIRGRIYKYITDLNKPLYECDVRFAVRSNNELKINELLFDAPMFFSFLKETNQIENNATDEECINSVAKSIAQYFITKVHGIEKHGSLKKVFFINIISWFQSREMFFSYLVSGTGKFDDFRTQADKIITDDIYAKLEERLYEENSDDVYLSNLQIQFNNFNENDPLDVFYELAFLSFFIESYCVYLFTLMDPEKMPSTLTNEEMVKFREMLMKIFNIDFNKAFDYFKKEHYPHCLEKAKKII